MFSSCLSILPFLSPCFDVFFNLFLCAVPSGGKSRGFEVCSEMFIR